MYGLPAGSCVHAHWYILLSAVFDAVRSLFQVGTTRAPEGVVPNHHTREPVGTESYTCVTPWYGCAASAASLCQNPQPIPANSGMYRFWTSRKVIPVPYVKAR